MARFDVYRNGDSLYLLDCQADVLSHFNTRFVVPLLAKGDVPIPADRLNPEFTVSGQQLVMCTQFASAVRQSELTTFVVSLSNQNDVIIEALDMLISGF
jgi:toxin CcdB